MRYYTPTILVCDSCKGTGIITERIYDHRGSTTEYKDVDCSKCNGTGKVMEYVVKIRRPFSKKEYNSNCNTETLIGFLKGEL